MSNCRPYTKGVVSSSGNSEEGKGTTRGVGGCAGSDENAEDTKMGSSIFVRLFLPPACRIRILLLPLLLLLLLLRVLVPELLLLLRCLRRR